MATHPYTAAITVRDNTGRGYTARALKPGDTYGNGAVWGEAFYQRDRLGVTVDGAPGTWYAATIAEGGELVWLDFGQGWHLTADSSAELVQLARAALATAGARGLA